MGFSINGHLGNQGRTVLRDGLQSLETRPQPAIAQGQSFPQTGPPRLRVISCLGVDLELLFLPHFVRHYVSLGIAPTNIHVILNSRDTASQALPRAERMAAELGLTHLRRWIGAYTSEAMWEERRALQRLVAQPGDWILNADMDEHHIYPDDPSRIVALCRRLDVTAVQGMMVDRLGPAGSLPPLRNAPDLPTQFPVRADLSISLFGRKSGNGIGGTVKLMLHRADVFPARGGHRARVEDAPRYLMGAPLAELGIAERPASRLRFPFQVDHYKWTAERLAKQKERMATPGASAAGLKHGARIAEYLERHRRIRLEDVRTASGPPSQRWQASARLSRWYRALRKLPNGRFPSP